MRHRARAAVQCGREGVSTVRAHGSVVGKDGMPSNNLEILDIEGSVLFLGSGFSRGAENIRGTKLPVGKELREELAAMLGIDSNEYDLKTIADEFVSRSDLNLYQTLYNLFTVRKLQDYQKE